MALEDWVQIEPKAVFVEQMRRRRQLLTASATASRFYISADEACAAEVEALYALLLHLDEHCSASHRVERNATGQATAVVDRYSGIRFEVAAFASCPLKLACMLVQEDFILLSPARADEPARFVGGCALFSFMEVGLRGEQGNMKCGEGMSFIHANVPGFNGRGGVGQQVARFFRALEPHTPYFRTNWVLVPNVGLDPLQFSLDGAGRDENGALPYDVNKSAPADLQLRVEFQSVRRLPKSDFILFTLHTFSDALPALRHAPKAAAVLRQAVLALDEERRSYRGMSSEKTVEVAALLAELAGRWQ